MEVADAVGGGFGAGRAAHGGKGLDEEEERGETGKDGDGDLLAQDGEGADGEGEDQQDQVQKGLRGEHFELDEGRTEQMGERGGENEDTGGDWQQGEAIVVVVVGLGCAARRAGGSSGHAINISTCGGRVARRPNAVA